MAASAEDKAATKVARSIFSRRGIDISQTDFRVQNGICYLRGTVRYLSAGSHISLQQEMVEVQKALRQKPGIRDVSFELTFH
jgi:hypothetical protein